MAFAVSFLSVCTCIFASVTTPALAARHHKIEAMKAHVAHGHGSAAGASKEDPSGRVAFGPMLAWPWDKNPRPKPGIAPQAKPPPRPMPNPMPWARPPPMPPPAGSFSWQWPPPDGSGTIPGFNPDSADLPSWIDPRWVPDPSQWPFGPIELQWPPPDEDDIALRQMTNEDLWEYLTVPSKAVKEDEDKVWQVLNAAATNVAASSKKLNDAVQAEPPTIDLKTAKARLVLLANQLNAIQRTQDMLPIMQEELEEAKTTVRVKIVQMAAVRKQASVFEQELKNLAQQADGAVAATLDIRAGKLGVGFLYAFLDALKHGQQSVLYQEAESLVAGLVEARGRFSKLESGMLQGLRSVQEQDLKLRVYLKRAVEEYDRSRKAISPQSE